MRLSRTDFVPVLAIVAGGVIGASLSFGFLGSCSADVSVAVPVSATYQSVEASRLADSMTVKLARRDYDTGLHYLKRNLWDSALLYFEVVATDFPQTEWAPWALYQMAETFGRIGYERDAQTTRKLLLGAYPDSEPAGLLEESKP